MIAFLSLFFYFTILSFLSLSGMEKESPNQEQQIARWLVNKFGVDATEDIVASLEGKVLELRRDEPKKYSLLSHVVVSKGKKTLKRPSEKLKQTAGLLVKESLESSINENTRKVNGYKRTTEALFCFATFQTTIAICALVAVLTGVLNNC